MSISEDLIDFNIIEGQKENIQSLPGGRSARVLANIYAASPLQPLATPNPSDTQTLNDAIRQEYEAEVVTILESDDPLDIYDRYVKWTLSAYPSATAKEAQLLQLLERATKFFLNNPQYKNDPRYLKLWLSYIRFFSDAPRETFAFLARHNIGENLALFYEEFASWLEGAGRWGQAEEVYKLGIDREARPAPRLLRKFNEFQQRHAQQSDADNGPASPALPTVRPALAAKIDPFAISSSPADPQAPRPGSGLGGSSTTKNGKPKMTIFSDTDDARPSATGGDGVKGWESIGSLAERRKENVIEPKPWVGETLKAGGKKSSAPKMAVFKDESLPQPKNPQAVVPSKEQVTVNQRTGRCERIFVNLEAVYPTPDDLGTEMSFEELRASARGWRTKTWTSEKREMTPQQDINTINKIQVLNDSANSVVEDFPVQDSGKSKLSSKLQIFTGPEQMADTDLSERFNEKLTIAQGPMMLDENGAVKPPTREGRTKKLKKMEINETQIIKTKLSSPSSSKKLKRKASAEPTMTFHTKAATDEIYDLFSQPLKSSVEEVEDQESEDDDGDDTDGDYTSGGESTGTTRLVTTSDAGDDETSDVKSVSEWSDFTARKHIPHLDDDDNEDREDTHESPPTNDSNDEEDGEVLQAVVDTDMVIVDHQDAVTPISPESHPDSRTMFVPIPPEDYVPPTRPYRDPAQVSQNRLPFMTPIAEKTESSIGASTCREEKDYFNSKTPSKENGLRQPLRVANDDPMSSPLQEVAKEVPSREKITQPALGRNIKVNKTTGAATRGSGSGAPLPKEIAPRGPIIQDAQCNPVDEDIRNTIFEQLQPPLRTYEGFFDHKDELRGKGAEIRKFAKALTKMTKNSNDKTVTNLAMPPILRFPGAKRQYEIKRELGAGAFAPVYLVEDVTDDELENDENSQAVAVMGKGKFDHLGRRKLEALKMEDPPTAWEFYIMRQAKRRLGVSRAADSIINVYEMHLYKDECYLIEEFRDQGTLLELVNVARTDASSAGGVMDESLVMFFAIELLRTVEALHSRGILHGDLKADNCLVRLDALGDAEVWSTRYKRDGSGGWNRKGLALIDFGRGIDMKVFGSDVQFIADWRTGPADCAEMRELRPWTHQIDYHGLAAVIHTLLFGRYIDTVAGGAGAPAATLGAGATRTYRLREGLKRYWQQDIWHAVFDLLLNPLMHLEGEEGARLPLLKGMRRVRNLMEDWLEANCEKGAGLQTAIRKVEYMLQTRRR
ncbi:MAG: hypothetical protein M1818_004956 [Claussenomyces sp. TS43310]|nr:MAG: hypothetical protein M1818_004956 [Claussenomyces sp. TS43310]